MVRKIFTAALFFSVIYWGGMDAAFGFDQNDVDIHGLVSQGYLKSSDNNYLGNSKDGSFQYNEIGISFSVLLTDELRFGTQLFSRDLGNYGNNDIFVDWAYLDYTYRDWLGVRAGKIKIPSGLYSRQRDADMLRTSILMPQSVYPESFRDLINAIYGASLYGGIRLGAFGLIEYELFGGTIDVPKGAAIVTESVALMEYTEPAIYDSIMAIADPAEADIKIRDLEGGMLIYNTPLPGLRLGVTDLICKGSYLMGPLSVDISLKEYSVLSIEYDFANFRFSAERMKMEIETDANGQKQTQEREGYYGAVRWDVIKLITVGAAYGEYYPDAKDKDGEDIQPLPDYWAWQKDITLSLRFNVNEYVCVKFETHFYDGLGLASLDENRPAQDAEQDWILYAVKASLNF